MKISVSSYYLQCTILMVQEQTCALKHKELFSPSESSPEQLVIHVMTKGSRLLQSCGSATSTHCLHPRQ